MFRQTFFSVCRNPKINYNIQPLSSLPNAKKTWNHSIIALRCINDKSFVGAFINSVRRQVNENKDLNQNIKQLQDTSKQIGDSEALKRAKDMFAKAKSGATDNAVAKGVNEAMVEVKKYADSVGKTVDEVLHDINENEFVKTTREKMQKVGEAIHKTTEPIRNHPAYKTVKSEVESYGEDASRYGGIRDKDSRRKVRQKLIERMEAQGTRNRIVKEDPTAGQNVILHKDSAWTESWNKFKENSSMMQGLFKIKRSFNESENTLISNIRDFTDVISEKLTNAFSESEQAKAIKILRFTVDPNFSIESFLKEARDYIVPEFLDAFSSGDQPTLKHWCSEASFNVLKATFESQTQQGLVADSKILDLRRVDVHSVKILEENNDLPVIILSFETQEVVVFRNKKTNEIVYGQEDQIERVRYVLILTKVKAELDNPITGGWKILELARQGS